MIASNQRTACDGGSLFRLPSIHVKDTPMTTIEHRLNTLGITLPPAAAPVANYVPFVVHANVVTISGQISLSPDGLITGKLGAEHDIASGQAAARVCAINLLAQLRNAVEGDWARVSRVLRLGGFVNVTPDFADIPAVINGASDLMVDVFGDAGRHARSAVGCANLPMNVAVEIEGMFALTP